MTDEVKSDGVMWTRLGEVERQSASHTTELRSIYAGLDEIRDVLVRIQENSKPNIGGMFLILLATCTFFVTVGGLSLSPVYRDLTRLYEVTAAMDKEQEANHKNRFTSTDGKDLEERMTARMRENEATFYETRERVARMEGVMGINLHGGTDR